MPADHLPTRPPHPMPRQGSLHIAQFSPAALGGGAERVAHNLHQAFLAQGQRAELWVGYPRGVQTSGIHALDHAAGASRDRELWHLEGWLRRKSGRMPGAWRLAGQVRRLIPESEAAWRAGHEDFAAPGVWDLVQRWRTQPPDVILAHNLHGSYFDLRALPALSALAPTILVLHDQWLLTGHCACTLSCNRWRTGCGACPDLTLYPPIQHDQTAANWRRKLAIYQRSKVAVTAPSQWLLDQVGSSPLSAAVVEQRLIKIGINRQVFRPGDSGTARARLGLPHEAAIVMFAANGLRANPWKDYATLERAVGLLPNLVRERPVLLVAVGEAGPTRWVNGAELRMLPFVKDQELMADYYRASDVYVHATRTDNSPVVVLEALACGTPVVASEVGGVPELVTAGQTGWLAPVGDAQALAQQTARLLLDANMRARFSAAAVERIGRDFDADRQTHVLLEWVADLVRRRRAGP